jgi:hypothetical protein
VANGLLALPVRRQLEAFAVGVAEAGLSIPLLMSSTLAEDRTLPQPFAMAGALPIDSIEPVTDCVSDYQQEAHD